MMHMHNIIFIMVSGLIFIVLIIIIGLILRPKSKNRTFAERLEIRKNNTMYCRHCGASIAGNSKFCNSCGQEQ